MADAYVQLASARSQGDGGEEQWRDVGAAIEHANNAYLQATTLSSSDNGDDLPGLLCNWGTGLLAAAEAAGRRGDSATGAVQTLLGTAAVKLQASLDFNRGDVQVRALRLERAARPT